MDADVALIPQRYEPAVPLDRLVPHPENPNNGDVELLSELLAGNGFAGAVLAQESSGRLIDGETRWRAAAADGMTHLPVLWLDTDDDTTLRLLASINESTRRGANDETALLTLLTNLAATPRGLTGVPWTGTDLEDMARMLTPPDLDDLAGDAPGEEEMWPMLRFRLSPRDRERFYALTDEAEDRSDAGRMVHLLDEVDQAV